MLGAILTPLNSTDVWAQGLREAIQARIDSGEGGGLGDDDDERMLRVHDFYRERNFAPLWATDGGANENARTPVKLLKEAGKEALHPNTYRGDILTDLISASDPVTLSALELVLSKALIDYGRDLGAGTVVPNKVNKDVLYFPKAQRQRVFWRVHQALMIIVRLVETLKPQTKTIRACVKCSQSTAPGQLKAGGATFRKGQS